MDGHALLGDLALYSCIVGDGGPRGYRRRGSELPEKYLPGRFLAGLRSDLRESIVHAVNSQTSPAQWFLRQIIETDAPHVRVPEPPIDRRWSSRGRWST